MTNENGQPGKEKSGRTNRLAGSEAQQGMPKLSGVVLDEEHFLTLTEMSQACAVQASYFIELVDEGLLIPETAVRTTDVPTGTGAPEHNFWRFTGEQMRRARMAARLQGDLGINLAGVAVALQLLDEIEELRERLEAISTIAHND
jgi:chaperone modulatory protein CbpM